MRAHLAACMRAHLAACMRAHLDADAIRALTATLLQSDWRSMAHAIEHEPRVDSGDRRRIGRLPRVQPQHRAVVVDFHPAYRSALQHHPSRRLEPRPHTAQQF